MVDGMCVISGQAGTCSFCKLAGTSLVKFQPTKALELLTLITMPNFIYIVQYVFVGLVIVLTVIKTDHFELTL
jgi:hypothetical protein